MLNLKKLASVSFWHLGTHITNFCHKTLLYSPLPGSPHWLVDYKDHPSAAWTLVPMKAHGSQATSPPNTHHFVAFRNRPNWRVSFMFFSPALGKPYLLIPSKQCRADNAARLKQTNNNIVYITWGPLKCVNSPPLDKMAAISQAIFSGAFSWMKNFLYWLKFHRSLFLRVQLTITKHRFR